MKHQDERPTPLFEQIRSKKLLFSVLFLAGCTGLVLVSVGFFGLIRQPIPIKPEESSEGAGETSQSTTADTTAAQPTESTVSTAPPTKPSEPTSAVIANQIASLDATSQGWGQGLKFDGLNRPVYALSNQKKYAAYAADFIRTGNEDGSQKTIYLTFDEGYENGMSAQILDVLKEKNAPAVFFVTKPYAKSSPELVRRMIQEGHIVGNHSVTHPSKGLPSQTLAQQQEEVMGCHNYVKDNFGYTMRLFRFPSGKFSEQSLALVKSCGYRSVFWSFAYKDYDVNNQMDKQQALDKLTTRLHPGAVYLLHAVSKTNADILADFIDQARSKGYRFASYL